MQCNSIKAFLNYLDMRIVVILQDKDFNVMIYVYWYVHYSHLTNYFDVAVHVNVHVLHIVCVSTVYYHSVIVHYQ